MKAFVIMPFGNSVADAIYKYSTKIVCEEFKLEVNRADEIFTTNPVLDDILGAIKEATVIIADISNKNPNVFYELGLAHLLKQGQTVMITQDDFNSVPFDVAHFRIIKYQNTIQGKSSFEEQLKKTLNNILQDYRSIYGKEFSLIMDVLIKTNTEHKFFALMALAESATPLGFENELDVTGHNTYHEMSCIGSNSSVKDAFDFFILFEDAKVVDNFLMITEKGKAFVELLKEKGYSLESASEFTSEGIRVIKGK